MTFREPEAFGGERAYCYPRPNDLIASNLLGIMYRAYADLEPAERLKIWEPMFGNLYHLTCNIRNKGCTIVNMVKVDSTRNVRARHE